MLSIAPRGLRLPRGLALAALALCALALPARADVQALADAKRELADWLGALPALFDGAPPATPAPLRGAWLAESGGPADLVLARRLCAPRYATLHAERAACVERLAAGDRAGAEAILAERLLPRARELSFCLVAAEAALAAPAVSETQR